MADLSPSGNHRPAGSVTCVDITAATSHVVDSGNAGISGALQRLTWPLTTVWGALSMMVILYDQNYQPTWRNWLFAGLFAAYTPVLAGMYFLIAGYLRAKRWPSLTIPGLEPPATIAQLMATTDLFARRQAERVGVPPRRFAMWGYRIVTLCIVPVVWLLWLKMDRYPAGSLGSKILLGGLIATGLTAFVVAVCEAYSAARYSFVFYRTPRFASLWRWLVLLPPPIAMWVTLELFRTGAVEDFVFSSGTAGATMASEAFPEMAYALLWIVGIYALGKLFGPLLTVEELLERYRGAQITLLRSFKDDEAGVDFQGPVKPDERWQQVRLEPQITQTLESFGPVVAISGDARTIDRLGARRVAVANDAWQDVVIGWIDASMMIVMLAGKTPSVRWELETIIARNRVGSLLVLLPPRTTDAWGNVEGDDQPLRLELLRSSFSASPWSAALARLDAAGVIGILFQADGSIETICSRTASDEDYRIAICAAIYCMLCRKAA